MSKRTIPSLLAMKKAGQKIVALTCYDYSVAQLLNEADMDVILVGDSLGMVKLGYSSTLPVTLEDMVYHTRIVARGNRDALLVADMPFMSYQAADADAVRSAGQLMKAGAHAVKLEGGREVVSRIRAIRAAQIPVVGHIGMTPQSVHTFGGYKVQARQAKAQRHLIADAQAIVKAGVGAIVVECVPSALGRKLSKAVAVPIIGIGAGSGCDGQILVIDDVLGLSAPPHPRFVKSYADLRRVIRSAAETYAQDVRKGRFPDERHSYS